MHEYSASARKARVMHEFKSLEKVNEFVVLLKTTRLSDAYLMW